MPSDTTLELLLSPKNLDLAIGKLYQLDLCTMQQKSQQGKTLLIVEIPKGFSAPKMLKTLSRETDFKKKKIFLRCEIKTSKDRSWEKNYQKFLKPFVFLKKGDHPLLWIDPQEKRRGKIPQNTLALKAGLAFGTGGHPTTQLAAELMLQSLGGQEKPGNPELLNLLDMGCGSSLLAMTAAKLGVQEIWAIDNDPIALEVSQENCELNHIRNIRFDLSLNSIRRKKFDLIVANILLPVLLDLRKDFEQLLKKNGKLIVSGLLYKDAAPLIKAYKAWTLEERRNRKGWTALLLTYR